MAFGLFKKKKQDQDDRYFTLKIKDVVNTAKDAVNLVFEKPETDFIYHSGQFITLIDEVSGQKIRRAYSLCSSPAVDENPTVTVKRVKGGLMSNHVNDNYKSGDLVTIMEPMGTFTLDKLPADKNKVVLIGGGSGITPLYSLLKTILNENPSLEVSLIYANRSEDYIIFKTELASLHKKHEDRFKLIHILEDNAGQLARFEGRLSAEIIHELFLENELQDAYFYVCGPQPMMDIASSSLLSEGVALENVLKESFEAGVTSPKEVNKEPVFSGSLVKVILEGEEHTMEVSADATILETALDQGLDMPYSCQSGLCTACRGKCLEGDITYDDAEGLSKEELDDGYRLLCIGKPASDKITVEVG